MTYLITLTFVTGLLGPTHALDPASLSKAVVPWEGSLQQCSLFGVQEIATWPQEHPGRVLVGGWRCVVEPVAERQA